MARSPFIILSVLHQASREVALHVDELFDDLGVTGQEGQLLAFVAARDGVPVTDLVDLLGTPKSTMTSILNRLAERGHLERRPNPDDRRSRLVYATENGRAVAERARERVMGLDRRLADAVDETDVEALQRIREAIGTVTGIDLTDRVSPPSNPSTE